MAWPGYGVGPVAVKRGRREEIKPKDLLDRYAAHKQFFDYEWGRIGLDLRRVRGPEAIRTILLLVPNIQWRPPFRDYRAGCLIAKGSKPIKTEELRQTRRKLKQVENNERQMWSEHHASYWSTWSTLPINFPKNDLPRIPNHWRSFGGRVSPLTGSPRLASNPPNAILNYLYSVLESETRLAAAALGLDPGLGVLHVDTSARDSFTQLLKSGS